MFVIGKRDMEANAVSVRVHGKGNLGSKPRGEGIAEVLLLIKKRRADSVRLIVPIARGAMRGHEL
jgi:threonyl-tRNA synthetase